MEGGGKNSPSDSDFKYTFDLTQEGQAVRNHSGHRTASRRLPCAVLCGVVLLFSSACWSCGTKEGEIDAAAEERAALLEQLAASEAALLDSNVVKGSPEYEALLRHDDSLLFLIYGETLEEDL